MNVPAKCKELGIEKIVFGPAALQVGGETVDIKLSYGLLQERTAYVLNVIAVHDDLLAALRAIVARINGVWDDPDLMAFGPLSTEAADIGVIASQAIAKATGA